MTSRKLSVREARMELEFAILEGNQQKIAEAEKQLQEALMRAAQKRRKSTLKGSPPEGDTSLG